ncbi:uncharacterized protein LOC111640108 [Centruroides sculpturatus]|uniref:uncharacterized protein LOC111640108 n=1 Tax=Centruroides sculpturatus TaxID=218467 RepID=UPI000C6DC176|nr:uncharacterized protein LOC111640108 [Centruroides sculpturatus]
MEEHLLPKEQQEHQWGESSAFIKVHPEEPEEVLVSSPSPSLTAILETAFNTAASQSSSSLHNDQSSNAKVHLLDLEIELIHKKILYILADKTRYKFSSKFYSFIIYLSYKTTNYQWPMNLQYCLAIVANIGTDSAFNIQPMPV